MATCPECRKQFPDDWKVCPEHGLALLPEAIFSNEDRELEAGSPVGDYVVESKLGEGSFGRVYRAVHPIIGRRVAVKVLNRALSTDPHAVSRFVSEARAIVELASPHIVDVYSLGALADGRQYYVMELLDGTSLDELIRAAAPLAVPVVLRILAGIADALAAAHQAGVVHRDLKPENVLVVPDSEGGPWPKLLDFGVAKLLGDRKLTHRTSTGALVGTPCYMAPEQALGLEVDHRSDIYAFGIVAFEMLTGKPPFDAASLVDLVRKHATEPPPQLSAARPELGDALDEVLGRLLEKDPAERPSTITEAFALLREAAGRAGYDTAVPAFVSLRPPAASASGPERARATAGGSDPARTTTGSTTTVRVASGSGPGGAAPSAAAPRHASTVDGTAGGAPAVKELRERRARSVFWLVAAGALVLGAVGTFAVARSGGSAEPTRAAPAPSEAVRSVSDATSAAGTADPPADAAADLIELRVEAKVGEARVFLDGADLGAIPGPFRLPRGEQPLRLEIRAAGYQTLALTIVPSGDRTERVELLPAPARPLPSRGPTPAKPSPSAASSGPVSSDLEVPAYSQGK